VINAAPYDPHKSIRRGVENGAAACTDRGIGNRRVPVHNVRSFDPSGGDHG